MKLWNLVWLSYNLSDLSLVISCFPSLSFPVVLSVFPIFPALHVHSFVLSLSYNMSFPLWCYILFMSCPSPVWCPSSLPSFSSLSRSTRILYLPLRWECHQITVCYWSRYNTIATSQLRCILTVILSHQNYMKIVTFFIFLSPFISSVTFTSCCLNHRCSEQHLCHLLSVSGFSLNSDWSKSHQCWHTHNSLPQCPVAQLLWFLMG